MKFKSLKNIFEKKIKTKIEKNITIKEIEQIINNISKKHKNIKVIKIDTHTITLKTETAPQRNEISFEKEKIISIINMQLKTKLKEARII